MAKQQQTTTPENIEVVTATEAFVDKYKKQIVACVIGVFVVAACLIGWNAFSNSNNQKASEAMFPCETYFTEGNYEKALNGDGAACVGFLKIADEYSSTKAGNLAHLYAGICLAQTDKYDEAAKQLEQFDMQDDAMVSPAALGLLGNVYVGMGQKDKAVETLKKAAQRADNPSLSPTYLVQAGQLLEADGKKDDALKLYREVKEKYPTSMVVQMQEIDAYIERASR